MVGLLGLILDFGVTFVLREKVRLNQYVANSLGFTTAVISNFYLNKYWTFVDASPDIVYQFTKFLFISVGGLLLSNGIIYALNHKKVNFYLAKGISILVVVLWNFIMNYKYSFG